MTADVVLKIGVAFAAATLAAAVVPRAGDGGEVPGIATLLSTGAVVGLVTTVALYLVLRLDLQLPATVALFAVGYNALVVLVKFVLGPQALYEASEEGRLETFFDPGDAAAALLISAGLFAAYGVALWIVYRLCRRRLGEQRPLRARRIVVVTVVAGAVLFATGGLPLVLLLGGAEYAGWVFSSGLSLVVAAALAVAVWFAAETFLGAADRARIVGDAAVIVSVFWIGLAFLALYHALWVVYVLVLSSIWPLKVITPK